MSNSNCNLSQAFSQLYIPSKCPTCGLLHPDCKNDRPRHCSPGSPVVGNCTLEECLSSPPLLESFQVPKFARKEVWVFRDYQRNPKIVEL